MLRLRVPFTRSQRQPEAAIRSSLVLVIQSPFKGYLLFYYKKTTRQYNIYKALEIKTVLRTGNNWENFKFAVLRFPQLNRFVFCTTFFWCCISLKTKLFIRYILVTVYKCKLEYFKYNTLEKLQHLLHGLASSSWWIGLGMNLD